MHLCGYQLRFQTPAFLGNAQQQGAVAAALVLGRGRHRGVPSAGQRGSCMTLSPHTFLMQAEGKQLEFKRDLSSPPNVLKTLVAFANSAGG